MTFYMNKKIVLEEKALTHVAINLCQSNSFKEAALNLEKPTYGSFLYEVPFPKPTYCVSDPETLSIWDKVKDDKPLCETFQESRELKVGQHTHLSRWRDSVDEQCLKLTKGLPLPNSLKQRLRPWMKHIALECLTYCRRQELVCEVSRYILMDIFTFGDYKLDGRIDEEKVARRLLEDERITVLQKYAIACFYFLEVHIKQLWTRLTREAKLFFGRNCECKPNGHSLILLWSRFLNGDIDEQELWTKGTFEAILNGNRLALMACWKRLQKPMQQRIVIDSALHSLDQWGKSENYGRVEEELVSPLVPGYPKNIEAVTLPSYYSELTVFFLSHMDQAQIPEFFKEAFKRRSYHAWKSVTKFLLDWPHQDCFLPTINQLWGIIPKHEYNQCLMDLTQKYSRIDDRVNCDYDYRSLLEALWEETPEAYKNFVLSRITSPRYLINETGTVLSELSKKSPFQYKDQMLFKQIFRDQPQEQRREMMFGNSTEGEFICSQLIEHEEWTFLNWFLKECMAEEEIASFKKQIISSFYCTNLCVNLFKEDRKKLVEDVFDWCLASDAEKAKFRQNFIQRDDSSLKVVATTFHKKWCNKTT